jgi:hypothetical protein
VEYIPSETGPAAIVVGLSDGVSATFENDLGSWVEFGMRLPNAVCYDLEYNAQDDVLLVGTMGRGAWLLPNASGDPLPAGPAGILTR